MNTRKLPRDPCETKRRSLAAGLTRKGPRKDDQPRRKRGEALDRENLEEEQHHTLRVKVKSAWMSAAKFGQPVYKVYEVSKHTHP